VSRKFYTLLLVIIWNKTEFRHCLSSLPQTCGTTIFCRRGQQCSTDCAAARASGSGLYTLACTYAGLPTLHSASSIYALYLTTKSCHSQGSSRGFVGVLASALHLYVHTENQHPSISSSSPKVSETGIQKYKHVRHFEKYRISKIAV